VSLQPYSSVFELSIFDPKAIAGRTALAETQPNIEESSDGQSEIEKFEKDPIVPFLLASYGGARVSVPFYTSKRHIEVLMATGASGGSSWVEYERAAEELRQRWGRLFGHHRRIRRWLEGRHDMPPSATELVEFGDLLFETLLPGDVRRLYDVARSRERDRLFMVFTSMIPWVFDLPWEFARDPSRGTFLATEDVHLIRNIETHTPVERLGPKAKLRMLIAVAEPRNYAALSARKEADDIRQGLARIDGVLDVKVEDRMSREKLHYEVATGNYDIVHFIGHGYWDSDRRSSGLVLEDETGNASLLGDRSLREMLSNRGIRVVFLNACDTGRSHQRSAVGGTAQDLFGRGVPNVVANQLKVGDRAAVTFARVFYRFLAGGKTVAQATREARIAASYRDGAQSIDWAIPVVYARDPNDRLVEPTAT
jgi:hypothetical protein